MANKTSNGILAAILGVMIAVSSVGCLISGFDLNVEQIPMIAMVAGLFAVIGAVGFSYRYGSVAVLGILGMASLFFWNGGEAQTQTQALITRISYTYDQAYQWGEVSRQLVRCQSRPACAHSGNADRAVRDVGDLSPPTVDLRTCGGVFAARRVPCRHRYHSERRVRLFPACRSADFAVDRHGAQA